MPQARQLMSAGLSLMHFLHSHVCLGYSRLTKECPQNITSYPKKRSIIACLLILSMPCIFYYYRLCRDSSYSKYYWVFFLDDFLIVSCINMAVGRGHRHIINSIYNFLVFPSCIIGVMDIVVAYYISYTQLTFSLAFYTMYIWLARW